MEPGHDDQKRTLHFKAPGLKGQNIEIAPSIASVKSKRRPLIEREDNELDTNIDDLDAGTRSRNRAFQQRIDGIWASCADFEGKLRAEAKEAVETILNLKDAYQSHVAEFRGSLLREINEIYDKVDHETIPAQTSDLEAIEKDVHSFLTKVVPENVEKQSGEVSRQLRRLYEAFQIEMKKDTKREGRLVHRASIHLQKTKQQFLDEDAFFASSFALLENDVIENERRASRAFAIQNNTAQDEYFRLEEAFNTEKTSREAEDAVVLDTVIDTQQILQQMVILHFGTKMIEDDNDDGAVLETTKLNSRIKHIQDRRAQNPS